MEPGSLLNGMGAKRYGMGAIGALGMQFAPGMQPNAGDDPTLAMVKIVAQVAPILLPIVMDGAEKVVRALVEAFAAYKGTVNQAQSVISKVTAVAPPVEPKV